MFHLHAILQQTPSNRYTPLGVFTHGHKETLRVSAVLASRAACILGLWRSAGNFGSVFACMTPTRSARSRRDASATCFHCRMAALGPGGGGRRDGTPPHNMFQLVCLETCGRPQPGRPNFWSGGVEGNTNKEPGRGLEGFLRSPPSLAQFILSRYYTM